MHYGIRELVNMCSKQVKKRLFLFCQFVLPTKINRATLNDELSKPLTVAILTAKSTKKKQRYRAK